MRRSRITSGSCEKNDRKCAVSYIDKADDHNPSTTTETKDWSTYPTTRRRNQRYHNHPHHSVGISIRRWLLRLKSSCCGHGAAVSRFSSMAVFLLVTTSIIAVTTTVKKKRRSTSPGRVFQQLLEESMQRFKADLSSKNGNNFVPHSRFEPPELETYMVHEKWVPDFGGLELRFLSEEGAARMIYHDFDEMISDYRDLEAPLDDDVDLYYAFDDDYIRGTEVGWSDTHDEDQTGNEHCRRTSEHRLSFPTCNAFHETSFIDQNVHYLNEGAYRQVMSLDHSIAEGFEKYVVKEMNYDFDFGVNHFEYVRMDAIVAERLSASPRIYDIYGYCGLSLFSEFFPHGDVETEAVEGGGWSPEDDEFGEELESMNEITLLDKLGMGCDMAEAIADLHGYKGGVIVHGDIQLGQFLYTSDFSLVKMNDFNRAEWMLWDDAKHEYCRYTNGPGRGSWRSPEEYNDNPLNEKVDIWSLGNNLYAILTGLWPFYHADTDGVEDIQELIKAGKTAFLDERYRTRSEAERVLVETIEKCWKYNPDDRPTIFEVAQTLRVAWEKLRKEQEEAGIVEGDDDDDEYE